MRIVFDESLLKLLFYIALFIYILIAIVVNYLITRDYRELITSLNVFTSMLFLYFIVIFSLRRKMKE